jgi:hypothetical protein
MSLGFAPLSITARDDWGIRRQSSSTGEADRLPAVILRRITLITAQHGFRLIRMGTGTVSGQCGQVLRRRGVPAVDWAAGTPRYGA